MLLKNNQQRAKIAIIFLIIILVLESISILFSYIEYDLLKRVYNDLDFSLGEIESIETKHGVLLFIYMILYAICAISVVLWFSRAYQNLHNVVNYLNYKPFWATWSWLVPFINLFYPYRIMNELFVETKKVLSNRNISFRSTMPLWIIGVWWFLWIINALVDRIIFKIYFKGEELEDLMIVNLGNIFISIGSILTGLLLIKIIVEYSKLENLLFQESKKETISENTIV
ncbi:MAG: DUF4328 domain-containing protein [Capnocytophaga sp.]|nr:DUF4328 domain-containing protein [Capnocytophaga sp.]